jgi:hypothetical protein
MSEKRDRAERENLCLKVTTKMLGELEYRVGVGKGKKPGPCQKTHGN